MCGINGLYSYKNVTQDNIEVIHEMNKEMIYRGPDEQDVWHDKKVALGHVRLSIIALDNGRQPILNEDKSLILVCNGEIYNHKILRKDLEIQGHTFSTNSDCEVLLHLYEEYGTEFFNLLNGMYAFAIYDIKNQKVILGRDRQGKKPLYYSNTPNGLVFSSELKAIKEKWLDKIIINHNVINQTIERSFSLSKTDTYLKGIHKVQPGHYLTISKTQITEKEFWRRTINTSFKGSYSDAKKRVLSNLEEAVKLRLESEVPMAVLLSGGIDSSAIAHFAKKHKSDIKALTIGYEGRPDCDESNLAAQFAKEKSIELTRIELDFNDFKEYLNEFLPVLDEPNGDIATFAQWGLYKKAKELGYKVLLSGNGGDELFFGYTCYNRAAVKLKELEKFTSKTLPISGYKDFAKLLLAPIQLIKIFRNLVPARDIYTYFNNKINYKNDGPNITPSTWFDSNLSHEDSVYDFVFNIWLTNNCFQLSDKLGMGNSLEIRCPFADNNLVDFVHTLPLNYRFTNHIPKRLLKDSLENILPDFILKQPKRGFHSPSKYISDLLPKEIKRKNRNHPYADYISQLMTGQQYMEK